MYAPHKLITPLLVSTLLIGCGGGGSGERPNTSPIPVSSAISSDYQGTWIAEAYGRALEIGANSLHDLRS